jgi:hypothetical protein
MELVTDKELAKVLKRSVQALRNDRCHGKGFPYIKTGRGFVRYDLDEIKEILRGKRIEPEK